MTEEEEERRGETLEERRGVGGTRGDAQCAEAELPEGAARCVRDGASPPACVALTLQGPRGALQSVCHVLHSTPSFRTL